MNFNRYIARQFGKPKGFGGRIVTAIMNRQNHPLYEETNRLLSLNDDESILDIGCGNGYVLEMLAKQYDCHFAGIDISKSILLAASKRNQRFVKNGQMSFGCFGADKMVFADAVFDKAYTINTVYFWEDLTNTMTEIKRVLKPGGVFINTIYTNETLSRFSHTQFGYRRFEKEQLTGVAQAAGFGTEVVSILDGTAYCLICHVR